MAKKRIQDYISEWMQPFGEENGYELSRSEFVKEGQTWYLRVYVDRLVDGVYDYMTSDDCEKISRYLSDKLDEEDPIPQNYYLEVSSPGMDRLLVSDKDFLRFLGEVVDVKLYESINGKKTFSGVLSEFQNDVISIKMENGETIEFPKEKASKVNLAVIF